MIEFKWSHPVMFSYTPRAHPSVEHPRDPGQDPSTLPLSQTFPPVTALSPQLHSKSLARAPPRPVTGPGSSVLGKRLRARSQVRT